MMIVNNLVEQIEELRDRLLSLQQHSDNSTLPPQTILRETFEELHVALEELQVTQELISEQNQQLSQQNQQLQTAYQAVAAESQRYQDLFEFAPDAYFVTDATGVINEANRAAASLLNMTGRSLVGKSLLTFIPELERLAFESKLFNSRLGDWIREWEIHLQPYMHQPIDVAITVGAVRNSESKLVAFRWLVRDISTQKQTEQALRESEARFRRVVDSNMIGIGFWNSDGGLTEANNAFLQLIGYTQAELQTEKLRCLELTPPEYRHLDERAFKQLETTGICTPYEKEYIHKDGRRISVWAGGARFESNTDSGVFFALDLTERKQLEKALQEKENQYRLLAHHFPKGGVFLLDRDFRYLIANGEAVRATGFSNHQIEGKKIWEVLPPESCAARLPVLQAALAGVETFDEITYGESIYAQHTLPVKNEQGEVIAVMLVAQDITQSRQAEQERSQLLAQLENKQRLLETILQQMPAGVVIGEAPSGQIIIINERLKQIVRGPFPLVEQISEYLQYDCFYPDGQPYAAQELPLARSLLTGEVVTDEELELVRADNTRATLIINSAPILDAQGQIVAAISICIDITERKQIEIQLRKAHQKLAFHVENSPLAVMECDENTQITRWSSAAEKLFGWTSEEVLGKRPDQFKFVFDQDIEAVNNAIYRMYIAQEPNIFISNRNYTKDGAVVYCEWYCSGLLDEFGRLESTLGLILDVTDRRKAEAQRDQLLVKEQEARAQAEAANRVKDEFLAVLSHELRSPLNAILGWSQMLQTRNLNQAATAKALETIERNARLQTQLIEDLLDVSRILQGKVSLSVNKINLVSVIESAIDTTRLAAEAKSVNLGFRIFDFQGNRLFDTQYPLLDHKSYDGVQCPTPQVIVNGDQNRLQQVIWNLLSNAIKFTPASGCVEIKLQQVRGDQQTAMKDYAEIAVSDTGVGISADFLPYVFEYFRQADGSTTRKYGGLGLGLAIVHHLVELHGGTVTAQSDGEGKGATFVVKLPLLKPENSQQGEDERQPEERKSNINAALGELQILVVDDDIDAREFLTVVLAQAGAKVTAAGSVSEAIAIFERMQPDVLVSDIGMPNQDGYALIRQVRAMEKVNQKEPIPAIALTAYAREEDRNHALQAGFQLHFAKPVNQTELVDAIANLAKKQKTE